MEPSVTDKIWEIITQAVVTIKAIFSDDEEEIIKNIVKNNDKCKQIIDYYNLKLEALNRMRT